MNSRKSDYIIRLAHPGELARLSDIEDAAGTRFLGTSAALDASLPNVPMAAFAAGLARRSLWVAIDAGHAPVGFLLAEPRPPWLHIRELDVHPDHNGAGLGRALVAAAEAAAAALGYDGLSLTTFRDIPWNAPWYARQGFAEVTEPPDWLAAILAEEAAAGLDPANRCAMAKLL